MSDSGRPAYLWLDGELMPWEQATVHVSLLGWSTMGGVFEGIKAYWNADHEQLYGWQFLEHFERLDDSMKMQRMSVPYSPQDLAGAALDVLQANNHRADVYVRPLAYHADADWFGTLEDSRTSVLIWTKPFDTVLGTGTVLKAGVSSWTRVSDNSLSPRIKCISNYQNSRIALIEANRHGYDQPILLNANGKVTEGPASCLFIVRDGVAITPSTTSGILESITRRTLLRLCEEELDIPVAEREVDRTELYIADEVFYCGTGAEVTPVGSVDGYRIGEGGIGPITTRIEHLFHDLVRGRHARSAEWCTPVYSTAPVSAAAG
jgi:branched-chain amino acid aminotransferase